MLKVGITGGIGSGKSTVCELFSLLQVPVYNADKEAKKLINTDPLLISRITETFGNEIYKDGQLNKSTLAAKVFNNRNALEQLNKLVHPAVGRDFENWLTDKIKEPYIIKEAALLFESRSYKTLDKIITVTAPENIRIERAAKRDNVEAKLIQARMAHQWRDEEKLKLSDYVIINDGTHSLIEQVMKLHEKFSNFT